MLPTVERAAQQRAEILPQKQKKSSENERGYLYSQNIKRLQPGYAPDRLGKQCQRQFSSFQFAYKQSFKLNSLLLTVSLISDIELFHPSDQCVGVNTKQFSRATWTANFAIRRSKCSINVRDNDIVDGPYVRVDPWNFKI